MSKIKSKSLVTAVFPLLLALLFLAASDSQTFAQENVQPIEEVRVFENDDISLLNPIGLAYSQKANRFFVLDGQSGEKSNIIIMTPYERPLGTITVDRNLVNTANITFDDRTNQLVFYNTADQELVKLRIPTDIEETEPAINTTSMAYVGLQDPRGLVIDPTGGQIFFLDSAKQQLVRVPTKEQSRSATDTDTPSRISRIKLDHIGASDLRGLALNPDNQHFYFMSPSQQRVYEVTQTGQVVTIFDLSSLN
jgi:sugar lactone lactonase YvrE